MLSVSIAFVAMIALAGCAPEPITTATQKPATTKSAQPTKTSIPSDNSVPTPSGTLVATGQLDCPGLTPIVDTAKSGLDLVDGSSPLEGSYEARAIKSGGQSCKWENPSSGGSITISMQKVSPEDYRDIVANLQALASSANFNSSNGSQSFIEQQGDSVVAHELNTTYWLTVRSNVLTSQAEFMPLMVAAEKQLVG